MEPSKSGVIGLLCAALGRPRHESVADLAELRFGVRVDQPGTLRMDFQTAGANYPKYDRRGRLSGRTTGILSPRYYLADACFLVGLEGSAELLERIDRALQAPRWQLFLGRKAFPPADQVRLSDGLRKEGLEDALRSYPYWGKEERVRLVVDHEDGRDVRSDMPLSFAERRFTTRRVTTKWMETRA